ncbi:MAG: hypothetical protein IT383_10295 [Deltaproteobacteria bacterium]|nr:hypothetical protein [Deltaproteobacteria bacterium]
MKRTLHVVLLLALAATLPACFACEPEVGEGEGEGEEGEGEGEEGEGEGEIELSAEAIELCAYSVAGTLRITYGAVLGFDQRCTVDDAPTGAELLAMATDTCEQGAAADWQIALDGARVDFDLTAIRACAAVELPLTKNAADTPVACAAPLTAGRVGAGGACVQGWDCPAGYLCESDDLEAALSCLPPAALGDPCASGGAGAVRSCAEGLVCAAYQCTTPAGLGASCEDLDCADGLRCDSSLDPSQCVTRGDVGDGCASDGECAEGLGCAGGACAARLADGAACVDDEDACNGSCSVCRPASVGGEHQCLDRGGASAGCDDTSDCHGHFVCTAGACVPAAGVGEGCVDDADCREGLGCDGSTDTCATAPEPGDTCVLGAVDCTEGACVDGTCVVAAAGSPCAADSHCEDASLLCVGAAPTGSCGAAPAIDAACSLSGACGADGYCSASRCVARPRIGETCGAPQGGGDLVCAAGAFCDEASGDCVGLFAPGQACELAEQCESGVCANGTCTQLPASCMSNPGWFQMTVMMGIVVPLRLRALRRRRR